MSKYAELVPRVEQSKYYLVDDDDIPSSFVAVPSPEPIIKKEKDNDNENEDLVALVKSIRKQVAENAQWTREKIATIENDIATTKRLQIELSGKVESMCKRGMSSECQKLGEKLDENVRESERAMKEFNEKNEARWEEVESNLILVLNDALKLNMKESPLKSGRSTPATPRKEEQQSSVSSLYLHYRNSFNSPPGSPEPSQRPFSRNAPLASLFSSETIVMDTPPCEVPMSTESAYGLIPGTPSQECTDDAEERPEGVKQNETGLNKKQDEKPQEAGKEVLNGGGGDEEEEAEEEKDNDNGSKDADEKVEMGEEPESARNYKPSTFTTQYQPTTLDSVSLESHEEHIGSKDKDATDSTSKEDTNKQENFGAPPKLSTQSITMTVTQTMGLSEKTSSEILDDARSETSEIFGDSDMEDAQALNAKITDVVNQINKLRAEGAESDAGGNDAASEDLGNETDDEMRNDNAAPTVDVPTVHAANGDPAGVKGNDELGGAVNNAHADDDVLQLSQAPIGEPSATSANDTHHANGVQSDPSNNKRKRGGSDSEESNKLPKIDRFSESDTGTEEDHDWLHLRLNQTERNDKQEAKPNKKENNSRANIDDNRDKQDTRDKQTRDQHEKPNKQGDNHNKVFKYSKTDKQTHDQREKRNNDNQNKDHNHDKRDNSKTTPNKIQPTQQSKPDIPRVPHHNKYDKLVRDNLDKQTRKQGTTLNKTLFPTPLHPATHKQSIPQLSTKVSKFDYLNKSSKPDKSDKPEKAEKSDKPNKLDTPTKPDKSDKAEKSKQPDKLEKSSKAGDKSATLKPVDTKRDNKKPDGSTSKPQLDETPANSDDLNQKWLRFRRLKPKKKIPSYDSIPSVHSVDSDYIEESADDEDDDTTDDERVSDSEGDDLEMRIPFKIDKYKADKQLYDISDCFVSLMPLISVGIKNVTKTSATDKVVVAFSRFDDPSEEDALRDLRAKVESLGGSHSENLSEEVTHLIIFPNQRRSAKKVYAAAQGCWILQPSWIEESAKEGKWKDEAECGGKRRQKRVLQEKWLYIPASFEEDKPVQAGHARDLMERGDGGITENHKQADFILASESNIIHFDLVFEKYQLCYSEQSEKTHFVA